MENYNGTFEGLGLSLDQEIRKENSLLAGIQTASSKEEIQDTILDLKEIAENSRNSRTVPIIIKCSELAKEGFMTQNSKEIVSEGISEVLFPILCNNILENKEKVSPNDLLQLMSTVYDLKNPKLREQVEKLLIHLIDPNTKNILKSLIDERTNGKL